MQDEIELPKWLFTLDLLPFAWSQNKSGNVQVWDKNNRGPGDRRYTSNSDWKSKYENPKLSVGMIYEMSLVVGNKVCEFKTVQ